MASRGLFASVFLCFFLSGLAWAGKKVVIVRSSSLSLYEKVVQGFKRCTKNDIGGDLMFTDDAAKNEALLGDVRGRKPDLVLTLGTGATRFIREKAASIPSAFAMLIDPGANKLAPPGVPLDLRAAAQVEFIHESFPQLKRIGILYSPGRNVEVVAEMKALQAKGEPLVLVEVDSIEQLDAAVKSLVGKADCLLMLTDPVIYSPQTASQLILQTLQQGLPIIAPSPAYVKAGALAGIYSDAEQNGCEAAGVVDKVLGGAAPASVPFAWPTKYLTAVNLVVADRLKIQVPASVVNSAEQVVK